MELVPLIWNALIGLAVFTVTVIIISYIVSLSKKKNKKNIVVSAKTSTASSLRQKEAYYSKPKPKPSPEIECFQELKHERIVEKRRIPEKQTKKQRFSVLNDNLD